MLKRLPLVVLFFSVFVFQPCMSQPVAEVRAVWLTTNWNLDWPTPSLNIDGQKQELRAMLDKLQQQKINTVFFQSRIRGDVFYDSKIEPMSSYAKKDFDALAFAVEECHKRGIECHAWFVTYPVGSKKQVAAHGKNSVVQKRKDLCKYYNGEWYLDPGNPQTKDYLLNLVDEIVSNYDVDGIHFDYIRYPDSPNKFPDSDTYRKYGKGMSLSDWRRSNINQTVTEIYDLVKKHKPWVQVSSSPIGKYKTLNGDADGWTAFESVFQDPVYWMQSGKQDAVYPMLYYKDKDFYPYLEDWVKQSNGRLVVPGLGAYRLLASELDWSLQDISDQIDYTREHNVRGQAYFRAGNLLNNVKDIGNKLAQYYQYPAKIPAMTWLHNVAPNSPLDLQVSKTDAGKLRMTWQASDKEDQLYTIYISDTDDVEINKAENILMTGIRGTQVEFDYTEGDYGVYYTVTASTRFHNESVPCISAYFVHSKDEK